jgi:hypothetical protein
MRVIGFVLAAVLLAATAGLSLAADAPVDPFARARFAITLPTGATVAKQEGPDFDVYTVKWGLTGMLGLYEGCCPQTFITDPNAVKNDSVINDIEVKQTALRDGEHASKEVYFDVRPLPGSNAFPFVVHAWYSELGEIDEKTAEEILASIRRRPAP